ncbi:sulfur carrier protein ThiS adenylyltransferase ThiF [Peptococcaceae bacterium]|nr:sulfur carrier protein ThiS adenylyltransferase ThiF [Peptococcaceae bacterium]
MRELDAAFKNYIGEKNFKKIKSVKVGVAGIGGLGSNCAAALVRSGFCNFTLVDFDVVEVSNLNRQFYFLHQVGMLKVDALEENLKKINPSISVEKIAKKISEDNVKEIFEACDVVVEAFDNVKSKCMIIEAFMRSRKLLVAASGIAGFGNSDKIEVRKVNDNFYIVGDMVSEVNKRCLSFAPKVTAVAAKQADVVLSWVLK